MNTEEIKEVESLKEIRKIAEIFEKLYSNVKEPEFPTGTIPVAVAAEAIKKDAEWIRAGIINGWFPVGYATLDGERVTSLRQLRSNRRADYTIFPNKFYKETGFVWRGEKTVAELRERVVRENET